MALEGGLSPAGLSTYQRERGRALFGGILETAASTYLLFIAVRHYQAGDIAKSLLSSSVSAGLLLAPLVVHATSLLRWRAAQTAVAIFALAGACFFLAALLPTAWGMVLFSSLALTVIAASVPLATQMIQDSYPEKLRGRLFSHAIAIRVAAAAGFSFFAGWFLGADAARSVETLLIFSAACWASAWCLSGCHSEVLPLKVVPHPLAALRVLRGDPQFQWTLGCWMLMGFGNLMMNPLRVEVLANPKHGHNLSSTDISLLLIVIPNAMRLVLSPLWGWCFDRMNFFLFRILLNLSFASAIGSFFLAGEWGGWITGAVLYGLAFSGGDIAWNLWVTKFAPPSKTADYMATHTFLTGIRGVLAPGVAFWIASHVSVVFSAILAASLIVLASLLLLREIRNPLTRRTDSVGELDPPQPTA